LFIIKARRSGIWLNPYNIAALGRSKIAKDILMAQTDIKFKMIDLVWLFGLPLFLLLIAWAGAWELLPDEWRLKYTVRFFVSSDNVTVQARPTDCDFFHAPVGEKSCHYERAISTVTWDNSATGHPMVSYDDGKTWAAGDPPPNAKLPIEYVYVSWNKVEDP
jgi:hypothetical protein